MTPAHPFSVLIAIHHFPPQRVAGAELLAFRTARWLIQAGHRVQVVCFESIDSRAAGETVVSTDEIYQGIPVRRLACDLASAPDPFRWSYDHPQLAEQFERWMGESRPDLVHLIGGYLMGVAPLRAARRLSIPTVVTLTDFWFLCPTIQFLRGDQTLCTAPELLECARCLYDRQRRFRMLDRRAPALVQRFWRMASRIAPLGDRLGLGQRMEALRERQRILMEQLNGADRIAPLTGFLAGLHVANGIDAARITVTPASIAVDRPPDRPLAANRLHFAYLGQIAPVKGVDLAVRAFRRLDLSRRGARLTLHGGLNAFPNYVRTLRHLAGNDPGIVFAGGYEQSQLGRLLEDEDVVLAPSTWHENAPHVVLEAFGAGRPVIGSDVGGITEILQPEVNGLVFRRGDADDLARQMQRLLDSPDLLGRLRRDVPRVRSLEEEMALLCTVYDKAMAHAALAKTVIPQQRAPA